MKGCARRLSTCPRITRAIVSQLTPPIASSSVSTPATVSGGMALIGSSHSPASVSNAGCSAMEINTTSNM